MTQDIKQQLATLAVLQKTEIEMAGFQRSLSGVEAQINELGAEIKAYEEKLADEENQLASLRTQYREDETETKTIGDRINKDNEKLRSVKTNKEYQSMLKEIDELKKKNSLLEDQMLSRLDTIEQTETGLAALKTEMAVVKNKIEQQQAEILSQAEGERQALEKCREERDGIFSRLDQKMQNLFEKVKVQGRGIAVAAVKDGVCQVCRMGIPPQMFNELLRMDSVRLCPNCQRIIYPKILIDPEEDEN